MKQLGSLGLVAVLAACGGSGSPGVDVEIDAPTATTRDAAPIDGPSGPFDPGPAPTAPIEPRLGELTILQLDLPAGALLRMGESAIIVGPDGTLVLLDAGNSNHAEAIRAELRHLNTAVLTPAHGFPTRAPLQVDWVVLTHYHGDHIGGMGGLLDASAGALSVTHGIVHRGFTELGAAIGEGDYKALCTALRGPYAAKDVPLCRSAEVAPCDAAQFVGSYPATDCPGLFRGDLASTSDDAAGQPSTISLGGGARLELVGATGFVSDGHAASAAPAWGHDQSNQENGRSVVGMITFGEFRYHFAGDLTGRGDTAAPDLESHLATIAKARYGARGVDIVHAHHHARRNANNATLVDLVAPSDGRARNVIAGINEGYLGSPYMEVLDGYTSGGRLGDGKVWVTDTTTGGVSQYPQMVSAAGPVIVQTVQQGRGYWVQAAGMSLHAAAFRAVAEDPEAP